jgi:hypothetical protein
MDDNTRYIAEQIFTRPPGGANSIDLEMDESTIDFIEKKDILLQNYIRDIISMITLHGIEILYGHRNIVNLSDEKLVLIKQYTRSYGFELTIKVEGVNIIVAFDKIY